MVRRTLVGGIAALAMVAWMGAPASAGQIQLQISPSSGPAGTTIHIVDNSSQCGDGGGGSVHIDLVSDKGGAPIASLDVTTQDEIPEFSADLKVPADAAPGEYLIEASCSFGELQFDYGTQTFVVTAPATTTTTSTTTTTVAAQASTTTTTVAPVAPAATPVVASPALTG